MTDGRLGDLPTKMATRCPRPVVAAALRAEARSRTRAPRAASLAGRVIDGLRIGPKLAEGGVGVVHAARVLATGENVAVKVLRPAHAGDAGIISRFEREALYAARVDHPNVGRVREAGRLPDGRPYYVMELYSGTTLGALVQRAGPLDLARALSITDQLLAGLEAIHAAGIVHRDLQPYNVFLARDTDGRERVKILDFGFAHEPGVDRGDGVTPDSPGALVGTLRFMSPEQATRARAITARSDLFAAALLLYYALTGTLPFRGRDDLSVVVEIVRSAPLPLRKSRRDAPRSLEDVLSRALAKHPDARFACAAEMRDVLAKVAV
jgi:eukaryotic-like serine/threonine-protein kinase